MVDWATIFAILYTIAWSFDFGWRIGTILMWAYDHELAEQSTGG